MQVLIATAVIFASAVTGSNDLSWSTNYGKAKTEAKTAERPLLIVMEDPSKPETRLNETEFTSAGRNAELLKKYQLCRIDVTTEYGRKVAEAFKASEFPYTACTDKTASFITYRGAGQMTSESWESVLSAHSDGAMTTSEVHQTYRPVFEQQSPIKSATPVYTIPSYQDPYSPNYCPNCVRSQYR